MNQYKLLNECLCCKNSYLKPVLDLGEQPLANNSLRHADEPEDCFPLQLNYCDSCTHLQLGHAVNPELMFKNYLYVTGTSQTMLNYLKDFVDLTEKYVPHAKSVMDIACNDGSLLDIYAAHGYETYGIDPAENLYELTKDCHNIELSYLNDYHAQKYNNKFDIVVAQNVMAHNSYPKEFLQICAKMINESGTIFVQNSQADMIKNNEFDTIYHEHLSFYSIKSFKILSRSAGLTLIDVVRVPIHGVSNLFVLSKSPDAIETSITDEIIINNDVIDNYALQCNRVMQELKDGLQNISNQGYKIIGYGSAAKGNTLINSSGISLEYIVDDNPLKQNLFAPGSRIPIVSSQKLIEEDTKICIVPLAWNYFEEIKKKCSEYINVNDIIYIKYFPTFEIIKDRQK